MPGYGVTMSKGRITANEMEWIWTPRTKRTGKPAVIMQHSYNSPNLYNYGGHGGPAGIGPALANAGYTVIAAETGGNTWANNTSLTASAAMVALGETLTGVSGCYMLGMSMGFGAALRYAQANPTKVLAMLGIQPVTDLQQLPSGYDAEIAAVWGVLNKSLLPAAGLLSSSTNKATIANIPIRLAYSTDDPVITPATVTGYTTGTNKTVVSSLGAVQHDLIAGANAFGYQPIIDFFSNNP